MLKKLRWTTKLRSKQRERAGNKSTSVCFLICRILAALALGCALGAAQRAPADARLPPSDTQHFIARLDALPIEYSADILLPAIGGGFLDKYPAFRDTVLTKIFSRAHEAAEPTMRIPAASALNSQTWDYAAIVGLQQLDSLSVQLRVLRILRRNNLDLAKRLARLVAHPSLSPGGCADPLVQGVDGYYGTLLSILPFNEVAVRPPQSLPLLVDFMNAISGGPELDQSQLKSAADVVLNRFRSMDVSARVYSASLVAGDGLGSVVYDFAARIWSTHTAKLIEDSFIAFCIKEASKPRCADDMGAKGRDMVAEHTFAALTGTRQPRPDDVKPQLAPAGPAVTAFRVQKPDKQLSALSKSLTDYSHQPPWYKTAGQQNELLSKSMAIVSSEYTLDCRQCEFLSRLIALEETARALQESGKEYTAIDRVTGLLANSEFEKTSPDMWLFAFKRFLNFSREDVRNAAPPSFRSAVLKSIKLRGDSVMLQYVEADAALGLRYTAGSLGSGSDSTEKALLIPAY